MSKFGFLDGPGVMIIIIIIIIITIIIIIIIIIKKTKRRGEDHEVRPASSRAQETVPGF